MMTERNSTLFRDLRYFIQLAGVSSRGWMVASVAGSIILAALDMLGVAAMVPLMTLFSGADAAVGSLRDVADFVGVSDVVTLTMMLALLVALIFVLKSACSIPFRWWLLGRTTRISADASTELMRRYVASPFIRHRTRRLPEVYRNIGDAASISSGVLLAVLSLVSDLLVLIGILAVLLITSPLVTLFTLVFFGILVGGVQRALSHQQTRTGQKAAEADLQSWQFLLPALDGFREARLTSSGRRFVRGYAEAKRTGAEAARVFTLVSELPKYVLEIGFIIAVVGVATILFATGGKENALTVLGVFAAASLRSLPTLNRVSATFATVRSGQVGLGIFVDAAAELDEEDSYIEDPRSPQRYDGDIELRDVGFLFPDSPDPVVRGLDLVIPKNSTVAFVGSSGAGKSTVLDLILGLLTPTQGRITCGGRRIDDDLAAWCSGIGVVAQDVFLIDATIAENVAFGQARDEISESQVWEALRQAELSGLVEGLDEGLQTVVGERGVRLSGGQRQRIGLARALYRRPRVLILDEATSALDNETEHQIAKTLQALSGQLTLIIVAHRLSTVRRADKLVLLEAGRVAAEGSFAEMKETSERFARLVELGELN